MKKKKMVASREVPVWNHSIDLSKMFFFRTDLFPCVAISCFSFDCNAKIVLNYSLCQRHRK